MEHLKPSQKKYLRGLAHHLEPVVFLGQKGITDAFIRSTNEALDKHELIKIKFIDYKEKQQKKDLTEDIQKKAGCELVGLIGHMAIFYRPHKDPKKRKIILPKSKA